jgi:hypothetical protein
MEREDEMYERGRDRDSGDEIDRKREKKGGKEAGSGALPRECAEIFKEAPLKWGVKWKSPLEAGCRLAGWLIAPPPFYINDLAPPYPRPIWP